MSALLLASFKQSRVTTDVCLAYVLTNIYPVAVIVVVVVWCPYAKACCGIANATAVIATAVRLPQLLKSCSCGSFLRGYFPF